MFFVTITCRGHESVEQAEAHYLGRTKLLLDAFRKQVKGAGGYWAYASVTERQERGHPHSHYLMTCAPTDTFTVLDDFDRFVAAVHRINDQLPHAMRFSPGEREEFTSYDMFSEWLIMESQKAGLGVQAWISQVETIEGASRYIAKGLFKPDLARPWPKKWKRVRYSRNWPRRPKGSSGKGFALLTPSDWQRVAKLPGVLEVYDEDLYSRAIHRLGPKVKAAGR